VLGEKVCFYAEKTTLQHSVWKQRILDRKKLSAQNAYNTSIVNAMAQVELELGYIYIYRKKRERKKSREIEK